MISVFKSWTGEQWILCNTNTSTIKNHGSHQVCNSCWSKNLGCSLCISSNSNLRLSPKYKDKLDWCFLSKRPTPKEALLPTSFDIRFHKSRNLILQYEFSWPSRKLQLLWVLPYSQSLYVLHIKLNPALSMLAQLCCKLFTSSDDASEKRLSLAPE